MAGIQENVDIGKVVGPEKLFGLIRWPEIDHASTFCKETDIVTGSDVVGSVCDQDDRLSLAG